MAGLIKIIITPAAPPSPGACTHPNLKDCGGRYWRCLGCDTRFTSAELATKKQEREESNNGKSK